MILKCASDFIWAIYIYMTAGKANPPLVYLVTPPTTITLSEPRYCLTTLPLERIVEIMKHLDWNSLLRIRRVKGHLLYLLRFFQTCKLLDTVSRDWSLWVIKYHLYVAR